MFIELLGWICTGLVLLGYVFNSNQQLNRAITVWIIGDIGWITYDVFIQNWSHGTLSLLIIAINLYGIYKIKKGKNDRQKTHRH
jgi:hypothetical protein